MDRRGCITGGRLPDLLKSKNLPGIGLRRK
jgi:hypothetical protein